MKAGGTILKPRTYAAGKARVELPARFNNITNPLFSYQLIVRFNMDRRDPAYKPFQTLQLEFHVFVPMSPRAEDIKR